MGSEINKKLDVLSCRLDKLENQHPHANEEDGSPIKEPCASLEELLAIPVETKEERSILVDALFQHLLFNCKYLTTF